MRTASDQQHNHPDPKCILYEASQAPAQDMCHSFPSSGISSVLRKITERVRKSSEGFFDHAERKLGKMLGSNPTTTRKMQKRVH